MKSLDEMAIEMVGNRYGGDKNFNDVDFEVSDYLRDNKIVMDQDRRKILFLKVCSILKTRGVDLYC